MIKFLNHYKILILIFVVFFGCAYGAIRFDQAMGWEKERNERNCKERTNDMNGFFRKQIYYWKENNK